MWLGMTYRVNLANVIIHLSQKSGVLGMAYRVNLAESQSASNSSAPNLVNIIQSRIHPHGPPLRTRTLRTSISPFMIGGMTYVKGNSLGFGQHERCHMGLLSGAKCCAVTSRTSSDSFPSPPRLKADYPDSHDANHS